MVFRKIADVKRERELAETRKNEGLDQISSDHPVRKLISKFRKISQENRNAAQNNQNTPTPPTTAAQPNSQQTSSPSTIPMTVQPPSAGSNESSPIINAASSSPQHLQLPSTTTGKTRDKLETISERIETQESQISQITSVNQSPLLHQPPKSSKWKWMKTGSSGTEKDSPARGVIPNMKPSPPQQRSTNPFDSNITDDVYGNERRSSIPLSLFIPRAARRDSTKASEDESDEHVRYSYFSKEIPVDFCLFSLFLNRNNQMNLILISMQHLGLVVVYRPHTVIINYYHH